MKKNRIPIFIKFLIILTFIAVIPVIYVGISTVNINKKALQISIFELHTQLAKSIADKISYQLKEIDSEIPYITKTLDLEEIPWSNKETILRTILDSHQNLISISLLDTSGKEKIKIYNPDLEQNPKLIDYSNDSNFLNLKSNNRIISSVIFDESLNPNINVFYNLAKKYFLVITISLKNIWNEVNNLKIGKTGFCYIIDEKNRIIAHKNREYLLKLIADKKIEEITKMPFSGSIEYIDKTNKYIIGAFAPVKELNWRVIVNQPKNEAYYSSMIIQKQAIYIVIITSILAIILSFIIARNLVKPIIELSKAAIEVSKKNFSIKINIKTNDELDDLISTFNDMTRELKKYEDIQLDRLIAEKTKTEAVIFSIADGIIMTDYSGKILLVNKQTRDIFNIGNINFEEKYIWDFVKDTKFKETLENVISNCNETVIREIDLSTSEFARFFQTTTRPVITAKGEKLGVVTVVRDITLEKELDRMKDDFLHSITHDLRNPITSIKGFLGFMSNNVAGPLNEQYRKMVEIMDRATTRLLNMVNDILDLAKLESGKIELNLTNADLIDTINHTLELIKPQVLMKNINIKIEKINEIGKLNFDQKLIERVINNLVGNAIKFTPEYGNITIQLEDKPDRVEIRVIDTGEGIPKEYLDKIFEKFQQVAGQRKGGTGLGLTICKHIVEAHNGKIWVESKLGEGSKFIFYIPKNI